MHSRRPTHAICMAVLALMVTGSTPITAQPESAAVLLDRAANLAHDLEHDQAIALLRKAIAMAPDDSAAHRQLANVLWLKMLFLRGGVTVDHYLGSFSRSQVDLKKPSPDLVAEFNEHVTKAIGLSEKRAAAHPTDPQAHYDLGAAVGLQASYTASVEGRLLAGFRAASRAYDEHERVLQLDPSRKDAGLIVGTYRYIVSTLSAPMRLMAYVVGFGGGRERGIRMIEETAAARADNRIDALFALVLVYNREKRYADAQRVLEELRELHPRNRLVLLEAGSTALRAGRPEQAEPLLTQGMGMLNTSTGPRIPGEESLWRYKRGAALVALGRMDAAQADLGVAIAPGAQAWVQGRARVELARIALRRGDRGAAAGEARQAETLCQQGNDPVCLTEARKLLRDTDGR